MSIVTHQPSVIDVLQELQHATAAQLAEALALPIEDVYAELVPLHDCGRAVICNARHDYRRGTGRAAIWSPA